MNSNKPTIIIMNTPTFNNLTPPPELVQKWWMTTPNTQSTQLWVSKQAARWGARHGYERACKPSLQEQALALVKDWDRSFPISREGLDIIRRALEQAEQAEEGVEHE